MFRITISCSLLIEIELVIMEKTKDDTMEFDITEEEENVLLNDISRRPEGMYHDHTQAVFPFSSTVLISIKYAKAFEKDLSTSFCSVHFCTNIFWINMPSHTVPILIKCTSVKHLQVYNILYTFCNTVVIYLPCIYL